jgi:hypothetical protein
MDGQPPVVPGGRAKNSLTAITGPSRARAVGHHVPFVLGISPAIPSVFQALSMLPVASFP